MLTPGESLEIKFIALIDKSTAPSFNLGEQKLDDILILHLENGKDFFVSLQSKR
jgi:phosphatidylinositol-bisphosphatase